LSRSSRFEDIRQYQSLVGVLAARPRFQGTAAGADPGVGDDEDLHVGMRADHGSYVTAIEHRARRYPPRTGAEN